MCFKGSSLGQYDSAVESLVPSPPTTPPEPDEAKRIGDSFEGDEGISHEEVSIMRFYYLRLIESFMQCI